MKKAEKNNDLELSQDQSSSDVMQSFRDVIISIATFEQNLAEMMRPIVEAISSMQTRMKEVLINFADTMRPIFVVELLGENQFVCWEYLSDVFINEIISADDVNAFLAKCMDSDEFESIDLTINNCLSHPLLIKNKRLFEQATVAFKGSYYDVALVGFTSVFDGLLSVASGIYNTSITNRANAILEKLETDEALDYDEYSIFALISTFQKTLESFAGFANFNEKEPDTLNRHWIMHGQSTRSKTAMDCIKIIHLIYGTLLLDDLGKKEN